MSEMSAAEATIYNAGERLIPGRSHDYLEVRRHYGSYLFIHAVIAADLAAQGLRAAPISIVDLGCGVGHGCHTLAALPGVRVHGVDMSAESLEYARRNYSRGNITLEQSDLNSFVERMAEYDYVISRGVLEHVPDGINLAKRSRWRTRLLFDVPYAEPAGVNPYHLISTITEESFAHFLDAELLYEDMEGGIYYTHQKPAKANMILCACRRPDLRRIDTLGISLPFRVDWSTCGPEAQEPPTPPPTPPPPPPPGLLRRAVRKLMRPVVSLLQG